MSIGIAIVRIAQFLRQRVIIRLQIVDILGMSIHSEVVPVWQNSHLFSDMHERQRQKLVQIR